jgi:putative DNA primase/helicase
LREEHFFLAAHRTIFRRMQDLAETGQPIDMITLVDELGRHNEVEAIGGVAYLSSLIDGVPDRPSIAHYIQSLQENATRRTAAKLGEQVQKIAADASVSTSAFGELGSTLSQLTSGEDPCPPRFSEEALALRFSRQYEAGLRYVAGWGRWMRWDEKRWREDDTLAVFDRCRAICRRVSSECGDAHVRTAMKIAGAQTVAAIERLARADRRHAATANQWDADPWLLNTPAGTIDLHTGELHRHEREQYMTKMTAAGPGGDCPSWRRFLDRVTDGNSELQAFLQRVIGYCLTGSVCEHALFFLYGLGANGKSVFAVTMAGLLGDYSKTAPISSFTASTTEQHPTDLAGLRGARFVTAIETEDGRWWAEAKIKNLTGGDRITARFMRQDFFEYVPQFKLVVAGNHKPGLRTVDEAIRRRLHLIPFTVTIGEQERDPNLAEKLKAEYPGILQWAITGCLMWQKEGLNAPAVVRDATTAYLASEDAIARWIEDRCLISPKYWSSSSALYGDFKDWCQQAGERERTQKAFAQALEDHGFARERTRSAKGFSHIGLKTDTVPDVPRTPDIPVTHARACTPYIGEPGTCGTGEPKVTQ